MAGTVLGDDDEFELYGPAAAVDTQTAAETQWVTGALAQEGRNFFEFVQTEMLKHGDSDGEPAQEITLDELLPPEQHTRIVASQAFLHLLSLAMMGMVWTRQEGKFCAPIHLSLVPRS